MNAGVPLLKLLLDDIPSTVKHRFQSTIVPRRSSYVRPPVSIVLSSGTMTFSMEMSI